MATLHIANLYSKGSPSPQSQKQGRDENVYVCREQDNMRGTSIESSLQFFITEEFIYISAPTPQHLK